MLAFNMTMLSVPGVAYTVTTSSAAWVQLTPDLDGYLLEAPIMVHNPQSGTTPANKVFYVIQAPSQPTGNPATTELEAVLVCPQSVGGITGPAPSVPMYGTDPLWIRRGSADITAVAYVPIDSAGAPAQP